MSNFDKPIGYYFAGDRDGTRYQMIPLRHNKGRVVAVKNRFETVWKSLPKTEQYVVQIGLSADPDRTDYRTLEDE
jgi:hypothetical protein